MSTGPGDLRKWVDAVGDVTIPLFAGFGFTTVVVVSDDARNFRWAGPTILVLASASVCLILAVQCAYHARIHLPTDSQAGDTGAARGRFWGIGTRAAYHCGIVLLLAGLGLALTPLSGESADQFLRWLASGIAFAACLAELAVIVSDWKRRLQKLRGRA